MRKYLVAGIVGVLALAFAAMAFGAQVNKANIKFTSTKAGSATGVSSSFDISDPANHTAGQEGKPTRQIAQVDIVFPKGTKFNNKKFPVCKGKVAPQIEAQCGKSKLAKGTTTIDGRGTLLNGKVPGKLVAYNTSTGLAIIIKSSNAAVNNQVLFPTFKGTRLVTNLRSTPLRQIDAYLSQFKLVIPKKTKGHGKKKVGYITLPKKCTASKKWLNKVKFTYFSGSPISQTTKGTVNKCKK